MCFWLNFVIKFIMTVQITFIGYIWIVYIIAANFAVLDTFSMNINDIFNQILLINQQRKIAPNNDWQNTIHLSIH